MATTASGNDSNLDSEEEESAIEILQRPTINQIQKQNIQKKGQSQRYQQNASLHTRYARENAPVYP